MAESPGENQNAAENEKHGHRQKAVTATVAAPTDRRSDGRRAAMVSNSKRKDGNTAPRLWLCTITLPRPRSAAACANGSFTSITSDRVC